MSYSEEYENKSLQNADYVEKAVEMTSEAKTVDDLEKELELLDIKALLIALDGLDDGDGENNNNDKSIS